MTTEIGEIDVRAALGYQPARIDGQYLVIYAPYHFVRPCDLHLTHLAGTSGPKVLNVQHLPRGSLLKVRTDANPQFELTVDAERSGLFYGSHPRNGQGVACAEFKAMKLRPNCVAALRVRTRREVYVEYQSRHETTIEIPSLPSGVLWHAFEHRDGFYWYNALVDLPAGGESVLTLPTAATYPAAGNFRGIDAVQRWDTSLAREISVHMVMDGPPPSLEAPYPLFLPPHQGNLITSGNDTRLTIYNRASNVPVTVRVSVGKLIPILTLL